MSTPAFVLSVDGLRAELATPDGVMRVVDGKAEAVAVKVLVSGEDEVLVAPDPLAAGDMVIIRGNERARPGQAVTIQE